MKQTEKIVKLTFHPKNLKETDEAYLPFQEGGLLLRFWALYKKSFLTSDTFKASLKKFHEYLQQVEDADSDTVMYKDIDEFYNLLYYRLGIPYQGITNKPLKEWVVEHWDYFNPNIQRKVKIVYQEEIMA